jgi:DNA-binding NarL/FixJ family response regulator
MARRASPGRSVRVCVISPHPFVLEEFRRIVVRAGFSAVTRRIDFLPGQGVSAEALPAAKVIVLDANAPHPAVEAMVSRIRSESPLIPLVLVAERFSEENSFALLRLGVRGLIRYADAAEQLPGALRAVRDAGYWVPRNLLSRFVTAVLAQPRGAQPGAGRRLSPRERQVVDALLENLSNKEIAARLVLSERTVKFHVSNVLAKYGVRRRADLILQTYHAGTPS